MFSVNSPSLEDHERFVLQNLLHSLHNSYVVWIDTITKIAVWQELMAYNCELPCGGSKYCSDTVRSDGKESCACQSIVEGIG